MTRGGVRLDGNADGTAGDDFRTRNRGDGQLLPTLGDSDGNGSVNALELNRFRITVGLSAGDPNFDARFDFNSSGGINALDINEIRRRSGATRNF